jgi:hypothetical protein
METKHSGFMLRKSKLHPLDGLMQLESQILFNDSNQGFDLFRLKGSDASS